MNKNLNCVGATIKASQAYSQDKNTVRTMERGYQEMADINLSLCNIYFAVESEVDTYYDYIAEREQSGS